MGKEKDTPAPETIVCPECGKVLAVEEIAAHLILHWGTEPPERHLFPVARRRYDLLHCRLVGEG